MNPLNPHSRLLGLVLYSRDRKIATQQGPALCPQAQGSRRPQQALGRVRAEAEMEQFPVCPGAMQAELCDGQVNTPLEDGPETHLSAPLG